MEIRVLVLGDCNFHSGLVGKTTFVRGLVCEDLTEPLPRVFKPIKLPQDQCINGCSITIIDSCLSEDLSIGDELEEEIIKAAVILLLFDISKKSSIDRIGSFWLKEIPKLTKAPVVLLANKIDLREKNNEYCFDSIVKRLTLDKLVFESIFECSGMTLEGIIDVFIFMQKTVLYPTGPLLDCSKNELTEQFKKALKLVFRRVDRDKDFYLSAEEVRNMQLEIFGHEIDFEGIEMIFKSIQELCFDGVCKKGLNFQGFCAMQIMMIHKLNADACWKILFFFGIGYDFRIHFDLEEVMSKSCNFTKDALVFLVTLFDQFCCEGWLGKNEVLRIFETCSQTPTNKEIKKIFIEFKDRVEINEEKINLSSWLSYWVLLSHENKAICAEFLLMLAFPKPASDLFLSSPNSTVKSAFITGFNSVGKSWALNTLIKRKTKDYLPTSRLKSVCNTTVQNEIPWLNEFLILTEIPLIEAETTINSLNLSETLIVLTNEDPESQKFSEKMNLKRFPNLLILENQARRLESSFLQSIFQDLPKFISKQVKTEKKVESSWKTLKLGALVLIFSILIGYFLR